MTVPQTTLRRPAAWFWQDEPVSTQSPVNVDYLIGFAIVAAAPAVFWPLAIKAASLVFGFGVRWVTLAVLGASIFAFLGTIYGLLVRRR